MPAKGMRTDPKERLLSWIDVRGEDECHPYKGYIRPDGYGIFSLNNKSIKAHRAVVLLLKNQPLTYDLTIKNQGRPRKGPVGARREVRHLCNFRACCNPKHVDYSDHSTNMRDAVTAGTHKSPGRKFTQDIYAVICASSEPAVILAKRFDVDESHVRHIRQGKIVSAREVLKKIIEPRKRLTPDVYAAILISSEPASVLAKRFNITREHVWNIRSGRVAGAKIPVRTGV